MIYTVTGGILTCSELALHLLVEGKSSHSEIKISLSLSLFQRVDFFSRDLTF